MKKLLLAVFALALTFTFGIGNASAQDKMMKKGDNPMVGGAAMHQNQNHR